MPDLISATINRISVDSRPSLGALTMYDTYNDIPTMEYHQSTIDYVNSRLGDQSYFTNSQNRYAPVFFNTINMHRNKMFTVDKDMRVLFGSFSNKDEIRSCASEEGLRNIPPTMQRIFMCDDLIYSAYRNHKIQGWGEWSDLELLREKRKWDRLLKYNGLNVWNPQEDKADDLSEFTYRYKSGDPDLTFQQLDDIEDTREYIRSVMEDTDLDPTDLDEIRG